VHHVPAELVGGRELWTGTTVGDTVVVPPHGARVVRR
jgi:hypothetical protein